MLERGPREPTDYYERGAEDDKLSHHFQTYWREVLQNPQVTMRGALKTIN